MHTTKITLTQDYIIVDLSGGDYDKLVIFRNWEADFNQIENHIPEGFNGRILIDMMTKMGAKNNERFLTGFVVKGKFETGAMAYVILNRQEELRVLSNRILTQQSPDSLEASVLTLTQQKMLLKGLSI
ncbi:type II toxin-antitoxin system RnlB family antitoxin [Paenibacillus glucanolyticus]|uniref:type II toxin-antitoxin system RnlB family antitoxin n=1 Tax=Paenibacillus glucanolyticus TaxID=59843 RepID=UPI00096FE38B|nr:type II toxin-antitoxin system RnlB family antitoxin [Paenibacillus glucanolyticus]OMF76708.1 hypothetical protein BK142_14400 [Paenibacillus glucanolyticus]